MEELSILDLITKYKYPTLYKEALHQQQRQKGTSDDSLTINEAIHWAITPQGHEFWEYINFDEIDKAIKLNLEWAHLFEDSYELKVGLVSVNNGLWQVQV